MSFRRLLKNITTGLYYDGRGGWTANHKEAHSFPDAAAVVKQAVRLGTQNLHLVLKFPDERLDVSHPLCSPPPPPGTPGQGTNLLVGLFPVVVTAAKVLKKIAG